MPSLAITGNLGSGKSSALDLLVARLEEAGARVTRYSADESNRRILREDPGVTDAIRRMMGPEVLGEDGTPDRVMLFKRISSDPGARTILEGILHPKLQAEWKPLAESFHRETEACFVAEIPLLFEKDLAGFFDANVLVACSDQIRFNRLKKERNMEDGVVSQWLALQESQERKVAIARHVVWNDGSWACLERQIDRLARSLDFS